MYKKDGTTPLFIASQKGNPNVDLAIKVLLLI